MIDRSLRPQIRVQHERSGVVKADDQSRRLLGLACRIADGPMPRSRDVAFELSGFSIASAQPSSNTDVEESMPRASDRHLTPAAQFPSNDVDSLGHLVAHRKNKTKIETNFAAILGKLDRKRDARNDALHVLRSDAQNSIVPMRRDNRPDRHPGA